MSWTKITRSSNVTTVYDVTFARKNSLPSNDGSLPSRSNTSYTAATSRRSALDKSSFPASPRKTPPHTSPEASAPLLRHCHPGAREPHRVPHFWPLFPKVGILTLVVRCRVPSGHLVSLDASCAQPVRGFLILPSFRLSRQPSNLVVHAIPPAAAASNSTSPSFQLSTPYCSTTVDPRTGIFGTRLGFFFGRGKSATFGWQFSQYTTPAPHSRIHNPPQCSQYFNSIRNRLLSSSL
jgi:hypothetical protein